ncbi:hypothetical protein BpHYR1_033933 [Brachionus plicatilis]|uniref:RNA-directed DNA polymerase from mobile element jockey-like n=1 Tax=Brachionus plicatilis TaxID=10195 RepID=A0A3M7P3Z5_BRAPC|nr:hypothetical protein BpHYR1_033933 [Brachionus plicatilis]
MNSVLSPTRSVVENKSGYISETSSLLNVVIHGKHITPIVQVVGSPYSDHDFVISSLDLKSPKIVDPLRIARVMNEKSLELITEKKSLVDFSFIDRYSNINDKWEAIHDKLIEILDLVSPHKKITFKKK